MLIKSLFKLLYGYEPKPRQQKAYPGIREDEISHFEHIIEHGIYVYEIQKLEDPTLTRNKPENRFHIAPKLVRKAADFEDKENMLKSGYRAALATPQTQQ